MFQVQLHVSLTQYSNHDIAQGVRDNVQLHVSLTQYSNKMIIYN